MNSLASLRSDLKLHTSPEKAQFLKRFFKTGPGQYGEHDVFLGITVPEQRVLSKTYKDLPLIDVTTLLTSPIHEERLISLFILIVRFVDGDENVKKEIFDIYITHTNYINNWDLVDASADKIVGAYIDGKNTSLLDRFAVSYLLWERRIAMIATYHFIKQGKHDEAIRIAEKLLQDKEDLIHKAVGWMLREVGKRCSEKILCDFLDTHARTMPRTTLRYALERLPQAKKKYYMMRNV